MKKAILLSMLVPFIAQAKDTAVVEKKAPVVDIANVKHAVKPMLWKVEKEGLEKQNWLFGTMHVTDPRITNLHPAAQKAFDGADSLYTEVDMDPASAIKASMTMIRRDGKTLSQSIGPELTAKVNEELKAINPQFTINTFNPMKTWLMVVLLPQLEEQLKQQKPLDLQLWSKAAKAGKATKFLETHEEQSRGLNALTEEEQITMLKLSLDGMAEDRKTGGEKKNEMQDLYIKGDSKALSAYLEKEFNNDELPKELREKFIKGILYDRNDRIANNIDKFLKAQPKKSHFFAVGCAHYLNDKNICQFLEKKGYKITRIEK